MTPRAIRGIVLRVAAHNESDKLVYLYSRERGRVTGLAKGALNSSRRFVNKLEEFSLLQMGYRPPRGGSGLLLLTDADLLRSHLTLRQHYHRYVTAMYLCELVLRSTREEDPDPGLFGLLRWALGSLDEGAGALRTAALFHLLLLTHSGYRPSFSHCVLCQTMIHPARTFALLPGSGGLLCSVCQPPSRSNHNRLSIQTLKILNSAQTGGPEWLSRLRFPEHAAAEALDALSQYSLHLLQQDVHSWKALRHCFQDKFACSPEKPFSCKRAGTVHASSLENRSFVHPRALKS